MNQIDGPSEEVGWEQAIYEQLRRIASAALAHEAPGHSLQTTLVVNDAYLRLMEQRNVDLASHSYVLAVGARIIRRLLVDYARRRKAEKRGGVIRRATLEDGLFDSVNQLDILELDDALDALCVDSPRAARVVELRFFGGLHETEIAEQLGVSPRTVSNDWRYAKAWLYQALRDD